MELKSFVTENLSKQGTEPLKEIHYKIRELIDSKDFDSVNHLIILFCEADADIGRLKTMLVITKSFGADLINRTPILSLYEKNGWRLV